jgi:hypothetical protein
MFPAGVSLQSVERVETDLEALTDEFLDLYAQDRNRFRAALHAYIFSHPSEFLPAAGA